MKVIATYTVLIAVLLLPLFIMAETIVVKTKAPQNRNAVFQYRIPKGYDKNRREMYRVLVIFGGRNTDGKADASGRMGWGKWCDDELRSDTGWFNGDIDYRTLFHELMHTWSDNGESNDNFKDSHMPEVLYYTDFSKWIWYKDEYRKIFE